MPKQKYHFLMDYLNSKDLSDVASYIVEVTIRYVFNGKDKKCVFEIFDRKATKTRTIQCLEAD